MCYMIIIKITTTMLSYSSFFTTLLFLSLQSGLFAQETLKVPSDYPTIQSALDEAKDEDIVLVTAGTYYENLSWPLDIVDLSLISEDGSETTIIDGGGLDRVINRHQSYSNDINTKIEIIGFTIQNGYLEEEEDVSGAGLNICQAQFYFEDLVIKDNSAISAESVSGGGMNLTHVFGTFVNCQFLNNIITGESAFGGALDIFALQGDITLINCSFENNQSYAERRVSSGALDLSVDSNCLLSDCHFRNNTSKITDDSGWGYGGAVIIRGNSKILNCTFSENELSSTWANGAALLINADSVLIDSVLFYKNKVKEEANWRNGGAINMNAKNFIVKNSHFSKNISDDGSAIFIPRSPTSINKLHRKGELTNCTFDLNYNNDYASFFGGSTIFSETGVDSLTLKITNSIFTNNDGSPISIKDEDTETSIIIHHSTFCINEDEVFYDNYVGGGIKTTEIANSIFWQNGEDVHNFPGAHLLNNLTNEDPLFQDEDNWIPSINSPAINSGNPDLEIYRDILGNDRPLPVGSNPDIGAYEINQDPTNIFTIPNTLDIKIFPNPSSDLVYFNQAVSKVKLYNQNGSLIKEASNTSSLNLTDLSIGSYILELEKDGQVAAKKLLVK